MRVSSNSDNIYSHGPHRKNIYKEGPSRDLVAIIDRTESATAEFSSFAENWGQRVQKEYGQSPFDHEAEKKKAPKEQAIAQRSFSSLHHFQVASKGRKEPL